MHSPHRNPNLAGTIPVRFTKNSTTPAEERNGTCTSCHVPHGSPSPSQLVAKLVNEDCIRCPTERRGPFLWEHPPAVEHCANCHDPHGSSNPQLLKVRMLASINAGWLLRHDPFVPYTTNAILLADTRPLPASKA